MKKIMTLLAFVVAGSLAAHADDYPYLAFQSADGSVKTMSVTSLTLTFSNGVLMATNGEGSSTFNLASLSKMFFTTTPTSVQAPAGETNGDDGVEVFTLTGIRVGSYRSVGAAQEQLKSGVYVVKSTDESFKLVVK